MKMDLDRSLPGPYADVFLHKLETKSCQTETRIELVVTATINMDSFKQIVIDLISNYVAMKLTATQTEQGSVVVEALSYTPEGRGFETR
jgi:hypothetical protein